MYFSLIESTLITDFSFPSDKSNILDISALERLVGCFNLNTYDFSKQQQTFLVGFIFPTKLCQNSFQEF